MNMTRMTLPTAVMLLAAAALVRGQNLQPLDRASDFAGTRIVTQLTGDQEVDSVATRATGHAYFDVRSDCSLHYKIDTTGMSGITGIYIQQGKAGQVGPVIAALCIPTQPTGFVQGTVVEGTLTANDLRGPLAGLSINDLVSQMMANNTYVNIATAINANGELRGNIPYPYS
jgi:hypothetical protein